MRYLLHPLGLMLALALLVTRLAAADLVFNTEEYPPYNFLDEHQTIDGISTRILRQALAEMEAEVTFRMLPWARAYTEARLRDAVCVYSTTRTPDREDHFQWVGPLIESQWAAFALPEQGPENAATLADLHNYRVGSFREDAVGLHVEAQGVPIVWASQNRDNLRRLEAGAIDVWVTGVDAAETISREQNVALERLFTFGESRLYLACNPGVDPAWLNDLQAVLDRLREQGTFQEIRRTVMESMESDT